MPEARPDERTNEQLRVGALTPDRDRMNPRVARLILTHSGEGFEAVPTARL